MDSADLRIAKLNYGDIAYQHILEGILSNKLRPGDRLRPEDLAVRMGLSPTPIKHALARLSGEGLVEFRVGKGPYVCTPTARDVLEMYEGTLMCELFAVQHGMQSASAEYLATMESCLDGHEAAWDRLDGTIEPCFGVLEANRKIHQHIVSLCPNSRVQTWHGQLNVHLRSFQLTQLPTFHRDYRAEAIQEHRAIYRSLANHDQSAALAAVRAHSEAARDMFVAQARRSGLL